MNTTFLAPSETWLRYRRKICPPSRCLLPCCQCRSIDGPIAGGVRLALASSPGDDVWGFFFYFHIFFLWPGTSECHMHPLKVWPLPASERRPNRRPRSCSFREGTPLFMIPQVDSRASVCVFIYYSAPFFTPRLASLPSPLLLLLISPHHSAHPPWPPLSPHPTEIPSRTTRTPSLLASMAPCKSRSAIPSPPPLLGPVVCFFRAEQDLFLFFRETI